MQSMVGFSNKMGPFKYVIKLLDVDCNACRFIMAMPGKKGTKK